MMIDDHDVDVDVFMSFTLFILFFFLVKVNCRRRGIDRIGLDWIAFDLLAHIIFYGVVFLPAKSMIEL